MNVAEAVATPIIRGETAFCTASVSGCIFDPRPNPKKAMIVIMSSSGVSAPTNDIASMAIVRVAEPMIGKMRYRPVREMSCPDKIEPVMMPSVIGSNIRPASVGVAPFTICK